jgi:Uma2 family endonuclease
MPIAESSPILPLRRWTVADYRQMLAAGVLTPDDRVELLDGQIIEMVPQDPPHASTTYGVHTSLKHLALAPPTPQFWGEKSEN